MYIGWNVQEAENLGILASLKISHFPFWFPTLKGSIREREGNGKNPFPKFGNGKGMKKIHSQNSGTGRERKNPFPKFGSGKGMKKIHSRNSGTGREWKRKKSIPEIREGNQRPPFLGMDGNGNSRSPLRCFNGTLWSANDLGAVEKKWLGWWLLGGIIIIVIVPDQFLSFLPCPSFFVWWNSLVLEMFSMQ